MGDIYLTATSNGNENISKWFCHGSYNMQTFAVEYKNLDIMMVTFYDHSITASAKACIKLFLYNIILRYILFVPLTYTFWKVY